MDTRFAIAAAALLVLPPDSASAADASGAAALLEQYCYDCHGDGLHKGGLALDRVSTDITPETTAATWQRVYEKILLGEMPPADEDPLSRDESKAVLDWIAATLERHGHGTGMEERLRHPDYGNVVDHRSLFDGSITEAPYTPARLWRYRPEVYKQMLPNRFMGNLHTIYAFGGEYKGMTEVPERDLFLDGHNVKGLETDRMRGLRRGEARSYSNPFFEFEHHASGFSDYGSIIADLASLEALVRNAEVIASTLTLGEVVHLQFKIKTKDSVFAHQTGKFAGGITGSIVKPFREQDEWFRERWLEGGYKEQDVFHRYLDENLAFDAAMQDEVVRLAFQTLLLRPPGEHELGRCRELLLKNLPEGRLLAIQGVIVALCISPEFVYRMELGLGERLPDGRRRLSDEEIFYALHYATTDKTPAPDWIERFRRDGWPDYSTRDKVHEAVLKTLAGLKFRHAGNSRESPIVPDWGFLLHHTRIRGFFREYFGYHAAPKVFKDPNRFPHSVQPTWMVEDTDKLVEWILTEDEHVFEKLLTDTRSFGKIAGFSPEGKPVRDNHRHMGTYLLTYRDGLTPEALHQHSLEHPGQPIELPSDQRSGILTQPAWLVAHSGNFDNDVIRRGRWIREKLLGQIVPEVPQDVDAKVPEDPERALRERLAVTREKRCWECHRKMDDLGYAFEMFNDSGQFRTTELGRPVDPHGAITLSDVPGLDGPVGNAVEMLHRLSKSDHARQVFLRHVFRYFMGRNEMPSDSRTLIEMDRAYLEHSGSFKHVLATLLSSDSFLFRK